MSSVCRYTNGWSQPVRYDEIQTDYELEHDAQDIGEVGTLRCLWPDVMSVRNFSEFQSAYHVGHLTETAVLKVVNSVMLMVRALSAKASALPVAHL